MNESKIVRIAATGARDLSCKSDAKRDLRSVVFVKLNHFPN